MHLILLCFHFDACLECQVTVISKLNFKKNVNAKHMIFKKKSVTSWIWTRDLLNASQLHYPSSYLCCGFQWNVARVFFLQLAAEYELITALTRGDKLEVGGWFAYDVGSMLAVPGELLAQQTDRSSALYIDGTTTLHCNIYWVSVKRLCFPQHFRYL